MSAARTLCLDFDDTLCDGAEAPLPGAREVLGRLHAAGWNLVLCSARFDPLFGELVGRRIAKIEAWLLEHRLPPVTVSDTLPQADLYLDDKGLDLCGDWERDVARVLERAGAGWKGRRGRVSFLLDEVATAEDGGARRAREGAPQALSRLVAQGCELALLITGDDLPGTALANELRALGFPRARVAPHKLSSAVYASHRGLRFEGDWAAIEARLRA
ncbi:MAG: hypothetical protein AB7N76_14645 [Planctomycetota bacterium]